LACGFAACTGDIVVMLDADGSTDPAEIPLFLAPLLDGADFAKGSRFLPGGGSSDITRLRRIGNYGLCAIVNRLFRTRYSDLCYGYNAFWRRVLPYMDLPDTESTAPAGQMIWGDGFEVETLINVRMAMSKLRVEEVASMEEARIHGVSNLNAFGDGQRVLSTILREFRRRRTPVVVDSPVVVESPLVAESPIARPMVVPQPIVVPAQHSGHFSDRMMLGASHEPVAVTGEG
jgi:glycosyltransferase involved in cell wall biosynthesis